jgi:hypothetical protein
VLTKEEIIKKIEENGDKIKSYGVKEIGVFGSYVRGEQKEKSDVDILVEFEKRKKTFNNYMGLILFLEDLFGCAVDLVIEENIKPLLKPYILGEVEYVKNI